MRLRQPRQLLLLFFLALAYTSHSAHAADPAAQSLDPHHLDGSSLGGLIDLSKIWLVHGGDDPRFADPAFDDSLWQVVSVPQPLDKYGIHDQPIVWYRIHIQIPPSEKDFSFDINRFHGSMQAYVNGALVGQLGEMANGGDVRQNTFHYLMPIPQSSLNHGELVIAIRAAIGKTSVGERSFGGIYQAFLGESALLQEKATLYYFSDLSSNALRLLLQAVTLFILIALVVALPRQREYLALAISFAFEAADNVAHILSDTNLQGFVLVSTRSLVEAFLTLGAILSLLEFVRLTLDQTYARWIRLIQASALLSGLFGIAWMISVANGLLATALTFGFDHNFVQYAFLLPYVFLVPGLLARNLIRRRNTEAALLFVSMLFAVSAEGYLLIGFILIKTHAIRYFTEAVPIHIFGITWAEVCGVTSNLALLFYIILRVVRTVREGARYASEVEAAQTVQNVLLARSQQATPGFKVETVYLPASEVGGDFFLVSPGADGSLLAIVGDVAGKGMLAAMRVSVILGILRREDSRQPGSVLSQLNDAMMLQGDMGLTTACCVRIEPDGRYALANAGHIPPYISGKELPVAGSLPLGIVAEQNYEEITGQLGRGEALILMSDGVVEAQSPEKELFGFGRLATATKLPANEIANAAKLFGQQDDITVLSLMCQG